jgi:hypothetical protein
MYGTSAFWIHFPISNPYTQRCSIILYIYIGIEYQLPINTNNALTNIIFFKMYQMKKYILFMKSGFYKIFGMNIFNLKLLLQKAQKILIM